MSHRLVQDQLDELTVLLLNAHEDIQLYEKWMNRMHRNTHVSQKSVYEIIELIGCNRPWESREQSSYFPFSQVGPQPSNTYQTKEIPLYGIFKTKSLSGQGRVRPVTWLAVDENCFALRLSVWRVCLPVSRFKMSHRLFQEQLDQLTPLLLIAHEDKDLDEEELLPLLTCGAEDAACPLPPLQFVGRKLCLDHLDEEACVRRVPLLVCPGLLPAPILTLSVLFEKKIYAVSRGLLREAGEEVRVQSHQLLGNFVEGRMPPLEKSNTLHPRLAQEKQISL